MGQEESENPTTSRFKSYLLSEWVLLPVQSKKRKQKKMLAARRYTQFLRFQPHEIFLCDNQCARMFDEVLVCTYNLASTLGLHGTAAKIGSF